MTFAYPWLGLSILLVLMTAGVVIVARRRARRDLERFAASQVFPAIMDFSGAKLRAKQLGLRFLTGLGIVAALIGPQWGFRWNTLRSQGPELIFALDTSKSMLAADLQPNRLERSKLAIIDLLSKIPESKAGLIAFAGNSFLQCPPTEDRNVFQAALNSLTVQSIPRGGTAIGTAIAAARRGFQSGENGSKVLIVMTDGENHEGDPVREAELAAKEGIRIFTIGIGSPEGERIPVTNARGITTYLKDNQGNIVKSKLNEAILREIAGAANGAYLRGSGVSMGLEDLYRTQLASLSPGAEPDEKWRKEPVNRFQIPLSLATIFLSAELILGAIGGGKFRRQDNAVFK